MPPICSASRSVPLKWRRKETRPSSPLNPVPRESWPPFSPEAPGAAERLHGSFVTYTKANKTKSLGVSADLLQRKGAVCREVAVAMAEGALVRSPATLAVSITGVAGPDPDEDGNPVGLVCIAIARIDGDTVHLKRRYGDLGREAVQERAMADALAALIHVVETDGDLDAAPND
jgi:nicotinamide-nucleotide amidase